MKSIKKMITLILALCTILSMAVPAFAASNTTEPVNLEEAWFPAKTMNITQVAYEKYSHGSQNAIDLVCSSSLIAPFTGKVVYVDKAWGYVVFQSIDKVRYANGDVDYMTVCFMHDENIDDMVNAYNKKTVIKQGTSMYQQGGMGGGNPNAYGDHVHLSVYRGKYTYPNKYGNGNVYAYDAFWINPKVTTSYAGRGEGYAIQGVNNSAPRDYRGRWKELDYFADCTFYPTLAKTVKIVKKSTFKSLPCSKKTSADSKDVRAGKMNERVQVVGLVKNSAGNYWFQVVIDGNKTAYLFAGDAKMVESSGNMELYHSVDGYHLVKNGKVIE